MGNRTRMIGVQFVMIAVCCLLVAGTARAAPVVLDSDNVPFRGIQYSSTNPVSFPAPNITLASMVLVASDLDNGPTLDPPPPGDTWNVDSFFDISYSIHFVGTPSTPLTPSRAEVLQTMTGVSDDNDRATVSLEIVSLNLTSDMDGVPVVMRVDNELLSLGSTAITDLGDGTYLVDSFFHVYFEVSVDDGGTWSKADDSMCMRMGYIPEPATAALLALGCGVAAAWRRRRRRLQGTVDPH